MNKYNFLFIGLICLVILVLFSCKSDTIKKEKESVPQKDSVQKKESIKETDAKKSVLEGHWISIDDTSYQVQVKANDWIEFIEGEKPETYKFAIGDSCLANINAKTNPNGKYVTVFDEGIRCFYIIAVNDNKLELSYMARGNTLTFKKKK